MKLVPGDTKNKEQWQEYLQENDLKLIEGIRLKTEPGLVVGSK